MSDDPANPRARAVFLSYAREDSAVVQRIAEALRASGVEVWFDQNELVGGDAWDAKIRGQIASCALFVPVMSANTQARLEGYFRLEWKLAANRSHTMAEEKTFLLPVVIDATRDAEAKVPAEFKAVQWTRLADGNATPQFVERIKSLLAPAEVVETGSPRPVERGEGAAPPTPPAKAGRRVPAAAWVVAAVVALAAGVFFVLRKPAITDKSIAVLPFANLGADKNDEYLGDGMTEELLNVFAKVPKLKVAARTSSFYFKGKNLPIADVGKQLGVAYVLEGSVRKVGKKLRITAQLINAADGYHLWSETYDREMTDLLSVQTEVAQQVVKTLRVTLEADEARAVAKRATENPEAHRLFLLGHHHFMKSTQEGWAKALEAFEEAIRLDPEYALAYCGIADTYAWMGTGGTEGRIAWAKEEAMARKALAIDPNLPEAHLSLGIALVNMFKWAEGESELRHALRLNPNLTLAVDQLAWTLTMLGRQEEGLVFEKRAVEQEPLSAFFRTGLAMQFYWARRFDDSIAQGRQALELDPNFVFAHQILGWALVAKREYAPAIAELRKSSELDDISWYAGRLGHAYALAGDFVAAGAILQKLEEKKANRYVSPGALIPIYIGLGEKDKALAMLAEGVEQQDGLCWGLRVDPFFDQLREDPRFQTMLKKIFPDK